MPPPRKGRAEKLGKRKGKTKTGSNITGAGSGAQKQLAAAEAAVTDRFGRVRQQKLQEEIAKGPKVKGLTSASGPVRQRFEKSPLGRLGIDPGLFGRSDLPTTNTQRTITASELANIGTERDRIANIRNKDARDLERLSQINQVLGLNRTSGMGIMDSLRQNFGGLQAQRDFANLGNTARGIANILPGRRLLTGLLNKIPGVNLPMQIGMNPVNFNITPEMRSFEQFSPLLSEEEQEQFSSPFLNRILFGSPADRTFEGPAQSINAFMNPIDLGTGDLYKSTQENVELANQGDTRLDRFFEDIGLKDPGDGPIYDMDGDGDVDLEDLGISDSLPDTIDDVFSGTVIEKDSALGKLYEESMQREQDMINNSIFSQNPDFEIGSNTLPFDDKRIFRVPNFEIGSNTFQGAGVGNLFAPRTGFRIGENTN